ncbi:MAG: hypothetical protein U0556_19625 [Dehalococcoidia bacterium]
MDKQGLRPKQHPGDPSHEHMPNWMIGVIVLLVVSVCGMCGLGIIVVAGMAATLLAGR